MTDENNKNPQPQQINVIVKSDVSNAIGIASFVFGIISIFFLAPLFVPLAVLLGIIAIVKKQLVWGIIGIICSIIGFATSPILLGIFGLVTIGTVGVPPQTYIPPQHIETVELSIPATTLWVDTGITLSNGENLNIRASGQWSNGGDSPKYVGPNGFNITFPGTILGSANLASLIGKVNGYMFSVGESYSRVSPASGKLFLSINDTPNNFSDNNGSLKVQVSRSK